MTSAGSGKDILSGDVIDDQSTPSSFTIDSTGTHRVRQRGGERQGETERKRERQIAGGCRADNERATSTPQLTGHPKLNRNSILQVKL